MANESDYRQSKRIVAEDYYFAALIMAAMQQADTVNLARLQRAFPDVWLALKRAQGISYD